MNKHKQNQTNYENIIERAVTKAIEQIGLKQFKRLPMFLSNQRENNEN